MIKLLPQNLFWEGYNNSEMYAPYQIDIYLKKTVDDDDDDDEIFFFF